jgi:predicted ester cyclase
MSEKYSFNSLLTFSLNIIMAIVYRVKVMSSDQLKALARQKYQSFRQSDIDKSLSVFPAFSDFKITVEMQVAEGNKVASYWKMTGVHTGEYLGIPPTGKKATLFGIGIDEDQDGRISEVCNIYDFESFLQRLKAPLS